MRKFSHTLYELFAGYEFAKGRYTVTGVEVNGKVSGRASTVIEPPTASDWEAHLTGKQGLGIIPIRKDNNCYFGALDIDDREIDHIALEKCCGGLPVVIARSKSGGAHVYVFFSEPVPADIVQGKLTEWAAMLGVGGCEIFPKQVKRASDKDVGNWLNMPYFKGDDTDRYMIKQGKRLPLADALAYIQSRRLTRAQLDSIVVSVKDDLFKDGPPCLQNLITNGFPQGTRNQGLYAVAVYFKKKNPDGYEQDVSNFNAKYMDPPLMPREVQTVTNSVQKKDYAYKCKEAPLCNHCNRRLCLSRKFGVGNGGGQDGGPKVQIGQVTKVDTDPPLWILDLEGERVEVDTPTLLNQKKFQEICIERIHKCPSTINASRWTNMINDLLKNIEVLPAPPDAGMYGQFHSILDQFLTERPISKIRDELVIGRCYHNIDKQELWFRASDLLSYLEIKRYKRTAPNQVWNMLRKIGARNDRVRVKTKHLNIWILDDEHMQRLEGESLDIPEGIADA